MSFPLIDLVPKKETNVLKFLAENPEYDGKNVTIGILDTGMDPGAHGVQYMADGVTPKLIDIVDCTGSGDVDMSTVAEATWDDEAEGVVVVAGGGGGGVGTTGYWKVQGLSGRTLKLSPQWNIMPLPTSSDTDTNTGTVAGTGTSISTTEEASEPKQKIVKVRLGIKAAYQFFPTKLVERVKLERRKVFDEHIARFEAKVLAELSDWKEQFAKQKPTKEQTRVRDDLQARLDALTSKEWDSDPGPIYDCVVFYDGSDLRAVVDASETGDLTQLQPMTSFAKERQFATFGVIDQLNYSVNFYDNGTVLTIAADATPHGTHVASITSGANGERSGVAPGAKLVSLKMGDTRLASMETGAALTRAMIEAIKHKCDIINLSYGEGSAVPNSGRIIQLAEDLVWKHNIIFVAAAGNEGPALSTVSSPGGTSSALIGVAAYVSPDMMKTAYSMTIKPPGKETGDGEKLADDEEQHLGSTYTWSSVGPTTDGDYGISVTAPGGAITAVSNWCLQKTMLMNGTSMSSPHTTGCVALLISACKAEGIKVSPERIRKALQNTAKVMPNLSVLQQGHGMVQVDKALDYLRAHKDVQAEDVFFSICVESLSGNPRGIYLRQMDQTLTRQSFVIRIDANFQREDQVSDEMQRNKIEFEMHFELEASVDWVSAPDHFMLMNNGRSFKIMVDPTSLKAGVHTAQVVGYDNRNGDRVPMFSVPITVVKPLPVERRIDLGVLDFEPAEVKRFFVAPPNGATWMDVTVKDCRDSSVDSDSSSKLFVLHTVQLLSHAAWRDFEKEKHLTLLPSQLSVTSIAVEEAVTCEITLARYWSTLGASRLEVSVEFHGIRPVPNNISMLCGARGSLVRIYSDLRDESVNPVAKLTKWLTPVRPKGDPIISPLGERDVLPSHNKVIYQLVLEYEFEQEEKGSFIPRADGLQGVLYESAFESQLMLVFDGEKKYLGVADAYPSEINVPKGTVIIRAQIRHDDPAKLEKMKDMIIWIERSIDKEIALSLYSTKEAMMTGEGSFKKRTLRKGCTTSVFISEPPQSKIPNACKAGDILRGAVTFGSGDASLPGEGKRPGGYPLSYIVGPKAKKQSDPEPPVEDKDEKSSEEKMLEAVRDVKVGQLGKLTQKEKDDGMFEKLYSKIEAEYPEFLPLLMTRLKYLDMHKERSQKLTEVVEAASAVIDLVPEDELATHFGRKIDTDDPASVKERESMKEKKNSLIEALVRMALAYASMDNADAWEKFDETLQRLKPWVDVDSNGKYAAVVIERETRAGRYGTVLKLLNKLLVKDTKEDAIKPLSKADLLEARAKTLEKLGFSLLVEYDKSTRILSSPKSFLPF